MDYSKILSVSGKPGLYEMISQTKNGFIVESLIDKKRFPVFAHERISTLEEISIFTTEEEDLPLKDVFKMIFEKQNGEKAIDPKSDAVAIKEFFLSAIPTYDSERVYVSDMKKVLSWYNLLLEKDLLVFEEEEGLPEEVKDDNEAESKPDEPSEESSGSDD